MIRLETDKRYYLIELTQDLFDYWCVICTWGSKFSKAGNRKTYIADDEKSAQELIQQILKIREKHHYKIIEN